MTVGSISSSFDRYVEAVAYVLDDMILIDREIKAFFYDPSIEIARNLALKTVTPLLCVTAGTVLGTAFGVYIFVVHVLLAALFKMKKEDWKESILELPRIHEYFPKLNVLRSIALGIAAWFPLKFLESILGNIIEKIFVLFGLPLGGAQDVSLLLSSGGLSGLIWMFIGCVAAPVGEEIFFRGYLQDLLKDKENPSSWNRLVTALKTNAIFSACHLSPFQGWFNIPVFALVFLFGMSMSLLRELTGDLWAPMTCHMGNNMILTAILRDC